MQTFLPISSFSGSAAILDTKRLGKQRLEAFQLLVALGNQWALNERHRRFRETQRDELPAKGGWVNHPAALMWKGHEEALGLYMNIMIAEWISRGYKNTMQPMPVAEEDAIFLVPGLIPRDRLLEFFDQLQADISSPSWLGDDKFHASHRSNLLRKDPIFYSRYGWLEKSDIEYFWPSNKHDVIPYIEAWLKTGSLKIQ